MTGVSYMSRSSRPVVCDAGLPVRRRRDRQPLRRDRRQEHDLHPPGRPGSARAVLGGTGFFARASSPTSALFFIIGKTAFALFSRPSPATSPTRSPTGRASPRVHHGWPRGQPVQRHGGRRHCPAGDRLPGRDRRRCPRRSRRPLDRRLAGTGVGTWPDAGDGDPASDHDHRRHPHDRRPGQADLGDDQAQQRY